MATKRVLVIGLGRLGMSLVETLWRSGGDVIVIDSSATAVDQVKDQTGAAFVGNASDPRVLEQIAMGQVDVAVVTMGEHFEASVLCVATLKKLGVGEIVARARTERQADILHTVGATRVVQPEQETGQKLATELLSSVPTDLLDFAAGYRVVPWAPGAEWLGRTLAEADLRRRWGINVLGVRPASAGPRPRLGMPSPDYRIAAGDTLLVVGMEADVSRLLRHRS
jgi:trk system potassium uptake protein TrkA